ncbi:hypothetical protein [uncultured Tolumonas sp.]|uniref:hypothetical protein n=1 Tax=uncultured Tolumonas sp. TaxID=263765 RepID=UPI002A0A7200|nr:hypothetical protein [uncultured Tolumonas sp.]
MTTTTQGAIVAGSVSASWTVNNSEKTASADVSGLFSGDATGSVDHSHGTFSMFPNVLPPKGTPIRYQWIKKGDKTVANVNDLSLSLSGNSVSGVIPDVPLIPGQTTFKLLLSIADSSEAISDTSLIVIDDGAGNLRKWGTSIQLGTLSYSTGAFIINAPSNAIFSVKKYEYRYAPGDFGAATWTWVSTQPESHPCTVNSPGLISCSYLSTNYENQHDITTSLDEITFNFSPNSSETVAAGSVRLVFGGRTYVDRLGYLYSNVDPLTGSGEQSGTFDYNNCIAKITAWTEGAENTPIVVESMLTYLDDHTVSDIAFRTPGAPVRAGSIYIQCLDATGASHDVSVPSTGIISDGIFHGSAAHENGIIYIKFGTKVKAANHTNEAWYREDLVDANGDILKPIQVKADSIRFNCVTYSYLPLDADIIKLDPVRLPTDGKVPILRKGGIGIIHSTKRTPFQNNVTAGYLLDVGRTRLAKCWLEDANGLTVPTSKYSVDLDYGKVTLATPLDLTGYAQPLEAVHRVEDMSMITDVEISGRLTLARPLSHNYDPADTYISSALIIDDLWARISDVFDQQTWTNAWSDTHIGSQSTAQFNATDYPITVKNRGAITERFALIFTSSTGFNVIGEHLGLIAIGSINEICAPINPNTQTPYFSINPLAWGSGWSTGNVLRFNLHGANAPFWIARTILQSEAAVDSDEFALQLRGNINKD